MAREIQSRLKISGTLVAINPLHIGGNGSTDKVDLSLAVNGQGQYYIPGTSLAGALREWMGSNTPIVNAVWGYQEQNGDGRKGHASYVFIEDAPIQDAIAEIRDGVGIDRYYGTAAERAKFDRAILPKGSRIPLEITLEQGKQKFAHDWEDSKSQFIGLLKALEQEEIRLGAAKTRGLGRVRLENLKILEHNLSTPAGMIEALRGQGTAVTLGVLSTSEIPQTKRSRLVFEIDWGPIAPIMVKAEADGIAVDMLPLVSGVNNQLAFVLPGSSIKGSLRTQAERIIRTLRSLSTPSSDDPNQRFIEQLQQVPLVQRVFGATAKIQNGKQQGRIGALAIDDCFAKLQMASNQWIKIESAKDESQLRAALNEAKLDKTQQAFHVAVDRWTGGAAEGFLYSTLEPMGFSWYPIRLSLDLSRLTEMEKHLAVTLLLFLLRDLSLGRITLGYATNRGMGAIKVREVQIEGQGLNDILLPLTNQKLINGNIEALPKDFLEVLSQSWQHWIDHPETEK